MTRKGIKEGRELADQSIQELSKDLGNRSLLATQGKGNYEKGIQLLDIFEAILLSHVIANETLKEIRYRDDMMQEAYDELKSIENQNKN